MKINLREIIDHKRPLKTTTEEVVEDIFSAAADRGIFKLDLSYGISTLRRTLLFFASLSLLIPKQKILK